MLNFVGIKEGFDGASRWVVSQLTLNPKFENDHSWCIKKRVTVLDFEEGIKSFFDLFFPYIHTLLRHPHTLFFAYANHYTRF